MKRYLQATAPYLGGKRKLAREIVRVMAENDAPPGSTLADAFCGAGAVSIAGKALGYRVEANDLSPISVALGKSLVENDSWTLNDVEIARALATEPDIALPDEKVLSLPENCREVLARLATREREAQGLHRYLMRAWIAKLALSMAMWGIPTMAGGRRTWDELTAGQAQQLKRTGRPMQFARKVAESLNAGVFGNGLDNRMHEGDALDFIKGVQADVLYADPPYAGTLAYEDTYRGVAELILPDYAEPASEWSSEDGWLLLERAFDAAEHIPLWVISMGKGADGDRIADMITDRGRTATVKNLAHEHLSALKSEHGEGGDELLVVGR